MQTHAPTSTYALLTTGVCCPEVGRSEAAASAWRRGVEQGIRRRGNFGQRFTEPACHNVSKEEVGLVDIIRRRNGGIAITGTTTATSSDHSDLAVVQQCLQPSSFFGTTGCRLPIGVRKLGKQLALHRQTRVSTVASLQCWAMRMYASMAKCYRTGH